MTTPINTTLVKHIAQLANIPIDSGEEATLAQAFNDTLAVIDQLQQLDVSGVEPTHQVTGLENITRADAVEPDLMFSQSEALANAMHTHQGYFVVSRIIDHD